MTRTFPQPSDTEPTRREQQATARRGYHGGAIKAEPTELGRLFRATQWLYSEAARLVEAARRHGRDDEARLTVRGVRDEVERAAGGLNDLNERGEVSR